MTEMALFGFGDAVFQVLFLSDYVACALKLLAEINIQMLNVNVCNQRADDLEQYAYLLKFISQYVTCSTC